MTPALARALGDRHRGVGFDQLAVIRDGADAAAEVDFWNADGTPADACGNATRCVARLLMDETGAAALDLRTGRGVLRAEDAGDGLIRVNMGPPRARPGTRCRWRARWTLDPLPLDGAPAAVGMGNPHCVFVVPDAEAVDLAALGPRIEHDPLFPERTNVEFVQVIDRATHPHAGLGARRHDHARLRLGRLRRGGGDGAARPDRAAGDGAARRRRARHRLARRRGLDDRPDRAGLRGAAVAGVPGEALA